LLKNIETTVTQPAIGVYKPSPSLPPVVSVPPVELPKRGLTAEGLTENCSEGKTTVELVIINKTKENSTNGKQTSENNNNNQTSQQQEKQQNNQNSELKQNNINKSSNSPSFSVGQMLLKLLHDFRIGSDGIGGVSNLEFDDKTTFEEVAAWGVNFDRLMKNKHGQKYFAEFLKSEYSDENILFWQACEELKREKNTEKIEEKARIIYEDFISILSPKEVSLDSRVREIINQNMVHPSSHTFDEAQNQIYTLMQRDSYPRFIASALYKRLLSSYGHMEDL
uniref:RGS domain-containing protein n=1 Tax=Meloidogyne floridensis TaxID=298350 RepID=A0A915P8N6_9BILA